MGLTNVTLLAALAVALSLVVERAIELLKAAYDLADCRMGLSQFWTRRAIAIRDFAQRRLRAMEYVEPAAIGQFLQKMSDVLLGPGHGYTGTVPTIGGDLVRASAVRIACKTIGALFGMALAFRLGLNLFALFDQTTLVPAIGTAATGIAIGLGAGPTHKIITALERQRNKTTSASTPAPEPANG
jgi:hypothetical protein